MNDGLIQFFDSPTKQYHSDSLKFIIDCSTICDREIIPADTENIQGLHFYLNIVTFDRGEKEPAHQKFLVGVDNEDEFHQWINALSAVIKVIRGEN